LFVQVKESHTSPTVNCVCAGFEGAYQSDSYAEEGREGDHPDE